MPMTVSGNLGGLAPDGSKVALANATIIVYPASNQYRVQYNGAGEFVPLVYRQDVAELPDPYRFGFLTRTDSGGAYSFKIPLASETHAIGAAHVMKLFLARLRQIDGDLPFWQRVTSERARDAIAEAGKWAGDILRR